MDLKPTVFVSLALPSPHQEGLWSLTRLQSIAHTTVAVKVWLNKE